jgi:phage terminase small subunit
MPTVWENSHVDRLFGPKSKVLQELGRIGFANILDYLRVDPATGDAHLDMSLVNRDKGVCIKEYTSETVLDGKGEDAHLVRKARIQMHDKLGALEKMGKHLGMFKEEKAAVNVNVGDRPLDTQTDEHWLEHLKRVHAAMAERIKKVS